MRTDCTIRNNDLLYIFLKIPMSLQGFRSSVLSRTPFFIYGIIQFGPKTSLVPVICTEKISIYNVNQTFLFFLFFLFCSSGFNFRRSFIAIFTTFNSSFRSVYMFISHSHENDELNNNWILFIAKLRGSQCACCILKSLR